MGSSARPPISSAKIAGLEARLAEGPVRFKTGATIERVTETSGSGEDERQEERLRVTGPFGRINTFPMEWIRGAYALALYGPPPTEQPKTDPAKFGDDPPY